MGRWMFSALPFAGSAAILLFSIRGSTIADDIFASAVRALHGDRDHQTFYFFQDFCFYSITAFSFCPLPASLSWDKPGVGHSTGDWTAQSMEDRAHEGLAAIRLLKERQEVASNKIGVWGISQAGWVLPLMNTLAPEEIAFIIAVSVPVGTGDDQELFQIAHQLPADGYTQTEVDKALAFSQLRLYLKNQQTPFDTISRTKVAY